MTPEELERNRTALSEPWNLDEPIEDLWAKISNIQRIAALGQVPSPNLTVITLTLATPQKKRPPGSQYRQIDEWTLDVFEAEYKPGNQERIRKLTAGDAGFYGARHAYLCTPPSYCCRRCCHAVSSTTVRSRLR